MPHPHHGHHGHHAGGHHATEEVAQDVHATEVPQGLSAASERIAKALSQANRNLSELGSATPFRGQAGAWIPGNIQLGSGTGANLNALSLLAGGSAIDLYQIAQQQPAAYGSVSPGQSVVNNWLNRTGQPFNDIFPCGAGVFVSPQLSTYVPLQSWLYEGCLAQINEDSNPGFYQGMMTMPPGTRMDTRVSSTVSNEVVFAEGFGALYPEGMFEFRDDLMWHSGKTSLGFVITPSPPLSAALGQLAAGTYGVALTPPPGAYMLAEILGYQIKKVGPRV